MMRILFFLILIPGICFSKSPSMTASVINHSDYQLNLYLPTLQFRYEDSANQSRLLKTGYSLNLALEIQSQFITGLEYNIQNENTGNLSSSIARDFSELNLSVGYKVFGIHLAEKNQLSFFGVGYLGQNKNKIKTELLGTSSVDESTSELSYGLGLLAQLRLNIFLIELDTRMMSSHSYEPQTVSVSDLRVGFLFEL